MKERIFKLKEISEALEKVIEYLVENDEINSDLLETLVDLLTHIDRKITRNVFNKKIMEIMEQYEYTDIDEGEREAVTERLNGSIRLYKDGRVDVWFYRCIPRKHEVEIYKGR